MAWSAPMTAVSNAIFTAAEFNQYVRDNLLETAPAKATAADRLIVTNGANTLREQSVALGSWAPAFGGWNLGSSAINTQYRQMFGIVVWRAIITLASDAAPSGNFAMTLPVGSVINSSPGHGYIFDTSSSANDRPVTARQVTAGSTINIYSPSGVVTSTSPFTFTTNDIIALGGAYLAATLFP